MSVILPSRARQAPHLLLPPATTTSPLPTEPSPFNHSPQLLLPLHPCFLPNQTLADCTSDASNLPEYSVRVVTIERKNDSALKAKTVAPLTVVLFLGFFLSCILLGLSIWLDDGMSIVATVLLSLLTSLIGLGNKWELKLPERRWKGGKVPDGDVVIRYPKGNFLIVRCKEDVARELYFAPETIQYLLQHGPAYRLLSLVGTMMLMGGVICLANAQIELQIAWAGSYMLLGSSYWIVAALPGKLHWDLSSYNVIPECLSDSKMDMKGYPSLNETFTQALWKTIVMSKNIGWIRRSNACPDTQAWQEWLVEARDKAKEVRFASKPLNGKEGKPLTTWQVPVWDAQKRLGELLNAQAETDQKSMKEGYEEV